MTTLAYEKKEHREHILHRPDTYLGDITLKTIETYIANKKDDSYHIFKKTIQMNEGLLRIFIELLSNIIDNCFRSEEMGKKCTKIKIDIDKDTNEITLYNNGLSIPIKKYKDEDIYIPELIFSVLLTSTNFNDSEKRRTSGRNGYGAKLTNIFSKKFSIKIYDEESDVLYTQTWTDNMSTKSSPTFKKKSANKVSFTQVSFVPDLQRFGFSKLEDDTISLFLKYILDSVMITKVNTYYNGELIHIKSLIDYANMYYPSPNEEMLYIKDKDIEVALCSNDSYDTVSFVNGCHTESGTHVNAVTESILHAITDHFNKKKKTPSKSPSKTSNNIKIDISDVRRYFQFIINVSMDNPVFASQDKKKLTSKISFNFEDKHLKKILKWEFVDKIHELIHQKELQLLKKTEKKGKSYKNIKGYDPANNIHKKNEDCYLIVCEGESAKNFAIIGLSKGVYNKKGNDNIGIFALKGKPLNVRKNSIEKIAKNEEITGLVHALNLKYDVDYTDDNNFKTLYYKKLIILTDSDLDGYHICGLVSNFIHYLFPSLLKREENFLVFMRTPIIRIYDKKNAINFLTESEYQNYVQDKEINKDNIKYFKGLASFEKKEVKDCFSLQLVNFLYTDKDTETISKVFDEKQTDKRKKWIESYNPDEKYEIYSEKKISDLSISDFLNKEMILFSIQDCRRSIPSLYDGLKESQRKILYAFFKKRLNYGSKALRVSSLAGYVTDNTNYHHGEASINGAIIKMAQNFVNSNNISLLYPEGLMGSRRMCGEDSGAPRYVFTKLEMLTRYMFREEDDPILNYIVEEGKNIEPEFYIPIVPTILINGSSGIGTAFSSDIPLFNPLDVFKNIRNYLNNLPFEEMIPWYRGFKGTIEKDKSHSYKVSGVYETKKNICRITEIPIDKSINSYKEFLGELLEEKKIKSLENNSDDNKIDFTITEAPNGISFNHKNLKLTSSLSTSNMVLFDTSQKLKKYASTSEILQEFCETRLKYYSIRKKYYLHQLEEKMKYLRNTIRFLKEINENSLIIHKKTEKELCEELHNRKYDQKNDNNEEDEEEDNNTTKQSLASEIACLTKGYRYLTNMKIQSLTLDKMKNLQKTYEKDESAYNSLKSTTEKDMWLNELSELESAYPKYLKTLE